MDEELLNEQRFLSLHQSRQTELVSEHCAGVGHRIRVARSRTEATAIVDEACRRFERECPSDIMMRALVHRVRAIVDEVWGKQKTY